MSGSGNEEYKKLNAHMLVGSPFPLDGTVPGPYLLEHSIKVAIIPSQEGKAFQKSSEELNCVPRNHHSFGIIFPIGFFSNALQSLGPRQCPTLMRRRDNQSQLTKFWSRY